MLLCTTGFAVRTRFQTRFDKENLENSGGQKSSGGCASVRDRSDWLKSLPRLTTREVAERTRLRARVADSYAKKRTASTFKRWRKRLERLIFARSVIESAVATNSPCSAPPQKMKIKTFNCNSFLQSNKFAGNFSAFGAESQESQVK